MAIQPMKGRVPRASWGARPPNCRTPLVRSHVKGIAVHYTGSDADEQDNHAKCPGRVRGIQNFHMSPAAGGGEGPWCDIAYSFVVCRHGSIYVGRGWYNRTAAQGTNSGNEEYLAVCFLGNDTKGRDDVTADGRAAMKRVFARFEHWYGHKPRIRPHSDFHATECPGDELRAWIKTL